MATGGSITLRLSLAGQEQVKQGLRELGPEGSRALKEIERATREPTAGMKALNAASGLTQDAMQDLANRAGPVGTVLGSLGPLGLAAAAGLGAAAAAAAVVWSQTRAAMEYADTVQDVAEKASVSSDAVQQWRYAVRESGGEATQADAALEGFGRKLGEAKAGAEGAVKLFGALGISRAQLDTFTSADQALLVVARRIAELSDASEQAAIAEKLGVGDLLVLLRQGEQGFQSFAAEAKATGHVMDEELVRKGAEAAGQIERLAERVDVQLKSAFVELAPTIANAGGELVGFAEDAAGAARNIAVLIDAFNRMRAQRAAEEARAGDRDDEFGVSWAGRRLFGFRIGDQAIGARIGNGAPAVDRGYLSGPSTLAEMNALLANAGGGQAGTRRLGSLGGAPDKPDTPKAAGESEEQRALKRAREALERLTEQRGEGTRRAIEQAQQRELQAHNNVYRTLEDRQVFEDQAVTLGREIRKRELDGQDAAVLEAVTAAKLGAEKTQQARALVATQRREVDAAIALADASEDSVRQNRQHFERERERVAREQASAQAQGALLGLQLDMANTQAERRRVALDMLDLERRAARRALEAELTERNADAATRAEQLGGFDADTARRRRGVVRDTEGVGERYLRELSEGTEGWSERIDQLKVEGLGGVEDALMSLLPQFDTTGSAFGRMIDGMIADLARMALQQAIIKPLAQSLFGGGDGGAGGNVWAEIASSVMRTFTGGSAGSGSVGGGGRFYPERARGGDVAGWSLKGERGPELSDSRPGSYIFDSARTERMLDTARALNEGRLPPVTSRPANDAGPVPVIHLTNRTGTPMQATARREPGGALSIDLRELGRQAIYDAARRGDLAQAAKVSPRPIMRGG